MYVVHANTILDRSTLFSVPEKTAFLLLTGLHLKTLKLMKRVP